MRLISVRSLNDVIPIIFWYENKVMRRSTVSTVTGWTRRKTGTGKSWTALKIGKMIDKDFGIHKVVYFVKDFLDVMDEIENSKKSGQVVVIDEAESVAPADRWQSFVNRAIVYTLATFRYLRCNAIFVQPRFKDIDVRIRSLLDFVFVVRKQIENSWTKIPTVWLRPYYISTDLIGEHIYMRRFMFFHKGLNRPVIVGDIKVEPLKDEQLIQEYERLHIEFKRRLREVMREEIEGLESYFKRKGVPKEKLDEIIDKIVKSDELLESITRNRKVDVDLLQECLASVFDIEVSEQKVLKKIKKIIEKRVLGR